MKEESGPVSSTLAALWEYRKVIAGLWNRISDWYNKAEKNGKILIIGPGGVGKTTLGAFLSHGVDGLFQMGGEYTESISVESRPFRDNENIQAIIVPGQDHRRDATWTGVLEDIRSGNYNGIILVFSHGHHSLGDIRIENHKLFDPDRGKEQFLTDYIENNMEAELEVLDTTCEAIKKCGKPVWMLTVVTKQDLWHQQNDQVEAYYKAGEFGQVIDKCLGGKDAHEFRHETVLMSLVIRNLASSRGEVLKQTTAGYDQELQWASIERLLRTLKGLMEWEKIHERE